MAKNKSNTGSVMILLASLLGLAGLALLLFLPVVQLGDDTTYTGMQVLMGHTESSKILNVTFEVRILDFSILMLAVILTAFIGILASLFSAVKGSKVMLFVTTLLLVAAGAATFFIPNFVVLGKDLADINEFFGSVITAKDFKLGVGAIVSGSLFLVSGVISLFSISLK